MERYIRGDSRAFDALYDALSPRVYAFLLGVTRDRTRADDLCQTAFLKFHRARGGWSVGAPVVPWIMAIAKNTWLDHVRAMGRAKVRLTDTGDLPETASVAQTQQEDHDAFDWDAANRALTEALAELPELQRAALVMTKQAGMTGREAAIALGTTETAVKLRVHRAVVALKARMSKGSGKDKA